MGLEAQISRLTMIGRLETLDDHPLDSDHMDPMSPISSTYMLED